MNRRQYSQIVILALIAGLVGGIVSNQFLMGQPFLPEKNGLQEKVIRAESFEVVDQEGEVLARLRQDAGIGAALEFVDGDGTTYMELSGGLGMDGLRFLDGDSAESYYAPGGFQTQSTSGRIMFNTVLGYGQLWLTDGNGHVRMILGVEKNGEPFINLGGFFENIHKTVIGYTELETPKTGETHTRSASSIVMFDKKGTVIWSAP